MNQNLLGLIQKYVQPIKQFIDKDETLVMLNPNEASQEELVVEYQKCVTYNNDIMTHKAKLDFLLSKLLEIKLQVTPNTEQGSRTMKQINLNIDYISQLHYAMECLRMKYKYNIEYYSRWC